MIPFGWNWFSFKSYFLSFKSQNDKVHDIFFAYTPWKSLWSLKGWFCYQIQGIWSFLCFWIFWTFAIPTISTKFPFIIWIFSFEGQTFQVEGMLCTRQHHLYWVVDSMYMSYFICMVMFFCNNVIVLGPSSTIFK